MQRRAFLAALLTAGCTPSLATFDRFAPHDPGARQVLRNAPFGPGPRQMLDVYAPAAPVGGRAPVIVFFYGGSWASGDKDDYGFMGDALASRGFVTVIPDYRVAPDVFPSFIEDGASAVRWARDHAADHGGDPQRIVLVGHSAGAYIAAMLALDPQYLANVGVEARRIRGMAGLAGPYDFLPFDVPASQNAFGRAPDAQLTQPVHFARADAPPLLLLWGRDDRTVGAKNIDGLERAMRAAGGSVETKRYDRVDHVGIMLAMSRVFRGRAPVLDDVVDFAERVTA
ncbi:alpha/beta hydrolase [Terricaulis sp.]|uniref:alpha/beta hydrolase n=1 Tax=Terricaulis sp. TaxID=2768686 RepID=UPI003785033F